MCMCVYMYLTTLRYKCIFQVNAHLDLAIYCSFFVYINILVLLKYVFFYFTLYVTVDKYYLNEMSSFHLIVEGYFHCLWKVD